MCKDFLSVLLIRAFVFSSQFKSSVENTRIDVEKCVNEHSEQMLMLLALLQDNRRRRGSVTGEANKDGEEEENGEVKDEKPKKGRKKK